jgi:uncharacterized membrane protein
MRLLAKGWRAGYDLILTIGILIMVFATTYLSDSTVMHRLVSLPGMLFCPGYLLFAALYPRRDQLDATARLVGSMAASVAIVVLLGLGLNLTPLGIDAGIFSGALLMVSVLMAAIAYYRRLWSPEQNDQALESLASPTASRHGARKVLLIGAVGMAIPLAVFYYVALFPPQQEVAPTTQFYMEPVDRGFEELSSPADGEQSITVKLGVVNLENQHLQYAIYRYIDGEPDQRVAVVDLESGEVWEMPYTFSAPLNANARQVVFSLVRTDGAATPYRTVYLWLGP